MVVAMDALTWNILMRHFLRHILIFRVKYRASFPRCTCSGVLQEERLLSYYAPSVATVHQQTFVFGYSKYILIEEHIPLDPILYQWNVVA